MSKTIIGHVFPHAARPGTAHEVRAAFEHYYVARYGGPGKRLRSDMATIPGTDDPFLWVESSPDYPDLPDLPDLPPNYYYADISEKWQAFLAGWVAGTADVQAAALLERYAGNW